VVVVVVALLRGSGGLCGTLKMGRGTCKAREWNKEEQLETRTFQKLE